MVTLALVSVLCQFGPGFYRESLFNHYHEVHAFQLGAFAAIVVVTLAYRGRRTSSLALLVGLLVLSLGFPNLHEICRETGELCGSRPIQIKPWYFLTGLLGASLGIPLAARLVFGPNRIDVLAPVNAELTAIAAELDEEATTTDAIAYLLAEHERLRDAGHSTVDATVAILSSEATDDAGQATAASTAPTGDADADDPEVAADPGDAR